MEVFWSLEVDPILAAGRSLTVIGVRNWALDREKALNALTKLAKINVPVLGGDVYSVQDGVIDSTYDNWYCNRNNLESDSAYMERSISAARDYILKFKPHKSMLFAIVPGESREAKGQALPFACT